MEESEWGLLQGLNDHSETIHITNESSIFGRSNSCSFKFTDKKVSSKHLTINIKDDAYYVTDSRYDFRINSRNTSTNIGTKVPMVHS